MSPSALPPTPLDDESFGSYLWRVAAAAQLTPTQTMHRLGVTENGQRTHSPLVMYAGHLLLSDAQVQRVALLAPLPVAQLQSMLLSRYQGLLYSAAVPPLRLQYLERWLGHRDLTLQDPWYCPACLAEDGAWRVRWHSRWVPVCTRHHRLLRTQCPRCEQPTAGGAVTPRSRGVLTRVPSVTHCENTLADGSRCGQALAETDGAGTVATDGALMAAQHTVETWLLARPPADPHLLSVMARLRAAAHLLHVAGQVGDLGPLPEAVALEFERHAFLRDAQWRWKFSRSGGRPLSVVRARLGEALLTPIQVAAVLPAALRLARSGAAAFQASTLDVVARHPVLQALPDAGEVWSEVLAASGDDTALT